MDFDDIWQKYLEQLQTNKQTVYWILAASKGWIKQTYRKIMRLIIIRCAQHFPLQLFYVY